MPVWCESNISFHFHMATFKEGTQTINNAVVLFRDIFDEDIFNQVLDAHELQYLTESDKIHNKAMRKGLYMSHVQEAGGETFFNYMRCSSNFDGPTDPFKEIDNRILQRLNELADEAFEGHAPINHVLLQVYYNKKKRNAKISMHADKTKDMAQNGLIAFFTTYNVFDLSSLNRVNPSKTDPGDYLYNQKESVLTVLKFRPKASTQGLREFSVKLYPNSVYIIPLSTNRLYTHEIVPPKLDAEKIPTRMGYVARCSATNVVIDREGVAYILEGEKRVPMRQMTSEDMKELRRLYYLENTTHDTINYGDIYYSMNMGDYRRPPTHV